MNKAQQQAIKLNPPQPKQCSEFKHWHYPVVNGKIVLQELERRDGK